MSTEKNKKYEPLFQGIIPIDKPAGMTSHDVVFKLRKLYGTKKTGHTGPLDPMATSVLVVLIGRAAKAAEYLTYDCKTYEATLKLGVTTDTEDTSGEILSTCENIPEKNDVLRVISSFEGDIMQTPPMYSALKVGGRKLVDLARQGIEVERESRKIHIDKIEGEYISDNENKLCVTCSKGTYIRTLCADIGKALGCGGCMSSLRRTVCGGFPVEKAYTLEALENMTFEERINALMPTEELFANYPVCKLSGFMLNLCKNGAEIYQSKIKTNYPEGTFVRLYDNDGFFALGEVFLFENGSAIKPIKVFKL